MSAFTLVISDFFVTGFEVWGLIFLMQNEDRKHGRAGVFIFGFILVGLSLIMTRLNFPLLLKFGCVILIVITIGQIVYSCRAFKLSFYALILIFAVYSSEMIVIQLWNLINEPIYSDNIIYEEFTLSLIIVTKALYFFEIIIFEYIIKGVNKRRALRDILPVLISSIPYLAILEIINISLALVKDKSMNLIFIFGCILIFVAFVCNVLLMRYYWNIVDAEQQEKKSAYELQLKCEYYMKRMQDEEQVKSIYHDLKNHLLFSGEKVLRSQMMDKLRFYEKYYNTGNDFLDIVLADKIETAWGAGNSYRM